MTEVSLVRQILSRMILEHDGDLASMDLRSMENAAEAEANEIEQQQREERIAAMQEEVYKLFEISDRMDEFVQDDDEESFSQAREKACLMLFERLTYEQQQRIRVQQRAKRSSNSGGFEINSYKTDERKREEDPDVKRGQSQIRGFLRRKRNSTADPGNYAGTVCLFTRHGWRPIVVQVGVERLLRQLAIWEKYKNEFPLVSNRVHFDDEDIFVAEWERLPDGTRSFVKIVSSMRR